MEKTQLSKEELKKQLIAIERKEEKAFLDEQHPIIKKKYEGKYFKSRDRYSGEKYWWQYYKVESVKRKDIYTTRKREVTSTFSGWSFQTATDGCVTIAKEMSRDVHNLETEISKSEFVAAYNKMKSNLPRP